MKASSPGNGATELINSRCTLLKESGFFTRGSCIMVFSAGGDFMKKSGMLVRKFELNPKGDKSGRARALFNP